MRLRAEFRHAAERIADSGDLFVASAADSDPRIAQLALIAAAARADQAAIGTWGRLEITGLLGEGGFGRVYRARDPVLDRQVALKLLRDCRRDIDCEALIREARLLARVTHPNVITIYGAERIGDEVGLWMELVEGTTLEALLETAPHQDATVIALGVALCEALSAVHAQGLVHGDVKPSNVLLGHNGRVVLSDFGTGRWAHQREGAHAATRRYAAPEVLAGDPPSPPSDIFSLGIVLRELSSPAQAALWSVLGRATSDRPESRFDSAVEFRDALLRCVPTASASGPRLVATVSVLAAVVTMMLSAAWVVRHRSAGPESEPVATRLQADKQRSARHSWLRGRQEWNKRTLEGFQAAMRHFEEALGYDPESAQAWSGVAETYVLLSAFGHVPQNEALPRATAAANRAIAIDPRLSAPHVALGYAAVQSNRVSEGLAHYRTAIALDPSNATAHHWYALTVMPDDPREALAAAQRAWHLDPLSRAISTDLAQIYITLGDLEAAAGHLQRVRKMFPDFVEAQVRLAYVLRLKGDIAQATHHAREAIRKAPLQPGAILEFANVNAVAGRYDAVRAQLHKLHEQAKTAYIPPVVFAMHYLMLNDAKETARWIDAGLDERAEWTAYLANNPAFDGIRSTPEMQAVLRKARDVWGR